MYVMWNYVDNSRNVVCVAILNGSHRVFEQFCNTAILKIGILHFLLFFLSGQPAVRWYEYSAVTGHAKCRHLEEELDLGVGVRAREASQRLHELRQRDRAAPVHVEDREDSLHEEVVRAGDDLSELVWTKEKIKLCRRRHGMTPKNGSRESQSMVARDEEVTPAIQCEISLTVWWFSMKRSRRLSF